MLFLGFSAGIPLLLIFSSLSLWLREAGAERAAVTYFSWAALGYSFKFVWAPLVDQLPLAAAYTPAWSASRLDVAGATGHYCRDFRDGGDRSLLHSEAKSGMDGDSCGVLLGFSSATQDIVIDAYRIESAEV